MPNIDPARGRGLCRPIVLSPADRAVLARRIRAARTEQRDLLRAQIVWEAARGQPNAMIAATLEIHLDTDRKWRARFASGGLAGLRDRPRSGRPKTFTDVQAAEIKAMACELPAESDLPLSRWSSTELASEAVARGIVDSISASTVRRARVGAVDESGDAAPLAGQVSLVAGGTRGATKAIAIALGAAGAVVHVTGRSTRAAASSLGRPETVEQTAEEIVAAGGVAHAHRVDHSSPDQAAALVTEIAARHGGRLDVLVNGIWGGDPLTDWEHPFWEQDVDTGLALLRQAVHTHIITSAAAVPLMVSRGRGLVLELTDGRAGDPYRGTLFYDLAKDQVTRLALGMAGDMREHGVAAVALAPGFLRSEAVLDKLGVTEVTWRDAIATNPLFAVSESPVLVARCAVALARDPAVMARSGQSLTSWDLAKQYALTDADGSRPDWGTFYADWNAGRNPDPRDYR